MTEEELYNLILNDAMLYAAYKLGHAYGQRQGYEEGQMDTEDYWRRQGNI